MRLVLASASFLFSITLAGCPTSVPAELGDCADGPTVTWTEAAPVFAANCTRCHSSTLTSAADRQSAPTGWDYDSADDALRNPSESWRRIYTGNMPTDADMTDADKLVVWEWYSCDGPQ
jgi:cytochrome c553